MPRKSKEMDKHHRRPRSRGGSNELRNISIVEQKLHRAWHLLVGNMTAPEVAKMLTDTWIDPDYYLVAVSRKRKPAKKRRKRKYCLDCSAEVLKHIPPTTKGGEPCTKPPVSGVANCVLSTSPLHCGKTPCAPTSVRHTNNSFVKSSPMRTSVER